MKIDISPLSLILNLYIFQDPHVFGILNFSFFLDKFRKCEIVSQRLLKIGEQLFDILGCLFEIREWYSCLVECEITGHLKMRKKLHSAISNNLLKISKVLLTIHSRSRTSKKGFSDKENPFPLFLITVLCSRIWVPWFQITVPRFQITSHL